MSNDAPNIGKMKQSYITGQQFYFYFFLQKDVFHMLKTRVKSKYCGNSKW